MPVRLRIARDTRANWVSTDKVIPDGVEAFETDTRHSKVGNGVSTYTQLEYKRGEPHGKLVNLAYSSSTLTLDFDDVLGTERFINASGDISVINIANGGSGKSYLLHIFASGGVDRNVIGQSTWKQFGDSFGTLPAGKTAILTLQFVDGSTQGHIRSIYSIQKN